MAFNPILQEKGVSLSCKRLSEFKRELWDDTEQGGSGRCWKTSGKVLGRASKRWMELQTSVHHPS
jgi:hypothetical protein